ncbi:MAG: hypothetical protein O2780_16740 [Proteobacteria bacterium]|jgi:hypothetical protein|nr:hypothetical protein [Pseudomonadota bacterium]MDA1302024.1 hypothetical protein [Pseudomonadota bacterium]
MSDEPALDPMLNDLFRSARQDLPPEPFTGNVLNRTRSFQAWLLAGTGVAMLLLLPIGWVFSTPLQELALALVNALATPILSLGEGWIGLLLMPVNNVGSAALVVVKLLRVSWRRVSGR